MIATTAARMGTIDNTGYRTPHQYQQCVSESVVKSIHCTHLTAVVSLSLCYFEPLGLWVQPCLAIAAEKCIWSEVGL